MNRVVIIYKTIVGPQAKPFGTDGGLRFFKTGWATQLKNKLNAEFKLNNMKWRASIDMTFASIEDVMADGADLLLISPYIEPKVDVSELPEDAYYKMSIQEFSYGEIEHLLAYIAAK